jgi:hypothetical protein
MIGGWKSRTLIRRNLVHNLTQERRPPPTAIAATTFSKSLGGEFSFHLPDKTVDLLAPPPLASSQLPTKSPARHFSDISAPLSSEINDQPLINQELQTP